MKYNPDIHHRKSIRIKDYDYSKEGMYYITICTKDRECILSEIVNVKNNSMNVGAHTCAQIRLTAIGTIVKDCLYKIAEMYEYVKLHDYVIMPNHIHMIMEIENSLNVQMTRAQVCAPTKVIGQIIRGLKAGISKNVGYPIWQRNYYEHVIRNEKELYKIIEYIKYNPMNWKNDNNYIN